MANDFTKLENSLDKKLQLKHLPITKKIDGFVTGVGEIFNWIWVALVAVIILNVILRYVFRSGMIELEELQWHLYAVGWLVGLSSTYVVDSHVRVDVFFASMKNKTKSFINAFGSIFLGASTCIAIIFFGLDGKRSIINSPILNFEVTQTGTVGMFIKYQMAGFLAIFAITMLIQFISYYYIYTCIEFMFRY